MRRDPPLKAQLESGAPVLATWCSLASAATTNVIAAAGFDCVIIDMEHGPMSFATAEDMVRAAESEGATALIRVPGLDETEILRALETGAHGVVVPQIGSAAEAERAVRAVKYGPRGARGMSPYTRSGGYTHVGAEQMAARENARSIVVLLVEGQDGLAELDAIAAVTDVDVIYIGVYDLSQSVGHPGEADHPKVAGALASHAASLSERGVVTGCLVRSLEEMDRARAGGVRFLAYQADCGLLHEASRRVVAHLEGTR